jgi:formylglycine-generating enzyme required for sulfatase activity/predicted Ser/Thr protein kinase
MDRTTEDAGEEAGSIDWLMEALAKSHDHDLGAGMLVGRYRLVRLLGKGGFGVVYRAVDTELNREVALKLLRASARSVEADARLLREAQAMAQLKHPNVVTVYDVGKLADGQVYVAMELVDGTSLRAWLAAGDRPWRAVLAMFLQAAHGLEAAHRAGLVHRDFKPDNVLVGSDGVARVADFGLARSGMSPAETLEDARASAQAGTPRYMAPEQARGAPPDPRMDQFSFAVALWEALCDRHPFAKRPAAELSGPAAALVHVPPRALMPAWLRLALMRALEPAPARRYPSIAALVVELRKDPALLLQRILLGAALLATALMATLSGASLKSRHDLAHAVQAKLRDAEAEIAAAHTLADAAAAARQNAYAAFDSARWPDGETRWQAALERGRQADRHFVNAAVLLEGALAIDGRATAAQRRLADVLRDRVLFAEAAHEEGPLVDELTARLGSTDVGGARRRELAAPAHVHLESTPPATVELARETLVAGHLAPAPPQPLGTTPLDVELAPGSYRLTLRAPGHIAVVAPLLVRRGEALTLAFPLPRPEAVPPGFVYVPAGRFLFGSGDSEELRRLFLNSAPLHEVHTDAYFIGRNEVTFGEWIEWLTTLPPPERRLRTPSAAGTHNGLDLIELPDGDWRLRLRPTAPLQLEARLGERVHFAGRDRRRDADWTRFPVAGISFEDAEAYAAWLASSGRVPGARLCDELEWERAARGADGRIFPSGPRLERDDANRDLTYGRNPLGFGPDEVGSHAGSRSPFGADDMAGNVFEWVRSVAQPGQPLYRGGCWYQADIASRSDNREAGERKQHHPLLGLRLCADAPLRDSVRRP